MDRKIQDTFVDYGCGFPVVLRDVPMVHVRGVWTPDINYDMLHLGVFLKVMGLKDKTAEHMKFIRHFLYYYVMKDE